jgi:7-keto-8-aminopelargonate synthetase-like enzyme
MKTKRLNNFLSTIDEVATKASKMNIVHLTTEDSQLDGKSFTVKGQQYTNFGSCSYLGLEKDERLIEGGIKALRQYGSQFSISRAYVSATPYGELEELMGYIFNAKTIVMPSTSSAHLTCIPVVVNEKDAVIMDQQVHLSVNTAIQLMQNKGTHVEIIRHNRMDILEERIKKLISKYDRVWYMVDGLYSMYGDFAPYEELHALLNKYEQLHLYVDDAHGLSCFGKHGSGSTLHHMPFHERMIITASFAKAFGAGGGVIAFPDEETYHKVRKCGSTLLYSGPLQPSVLGACIESAKIHLSDEIYTLQNSLQDKISYCQKLLEKHNLPVMSNPLSPIFFIGVGLPKVGYNLVKRIMNEGCYVNLGIFPAVPIKCTGVRFAINNHHTKKDIENLVLALITNYSDALNEEHRTIEDIYKAFNLNSKIEKTKDMPVKYKPETPGVSLPEDFTGNRKLHSMFDLVYENSIENVPKQIWNSFFEENGTFDWDGLVFLENVSKNNPRKEHNWDFHYFIIRDKKDGKVILATFFTSGIWKDDMLADPTVSKKVEQERKNSPYYLTSKVLSMGSLASEGNHLYIDKAHKEWKKALMFMLDKVGELKDRIQANTLVLRDFDENDTEMKEFFNSEGFSTVKMPDSHILEDAHSWNEISDYLQTLSKRSRRHVKYDAVRHMDKFEVEVKSKLTEDEKLHFYNLYMNVKSKNYEVNVYEYPVKLLDYISESENWEFVSIKLKDGGDNQENKLPIAVFFGCKSGNTYSTPVVGLDYDYLDSHKIYKQALFQMVLRANALKAKRLYLGFTATIEKQKLGANPHARVAYFQVKDHFNMEVINFISAQKTELKEV